MHLTKDAIELIEDDILDTIIDNDLNYPTKFFCLKTRKKDNTLMGIISLLNIDSLWFGIYIKAISLKPYYTATSVDDNGNYINNYKYDTLEKCLDANEGCTQKYPILHDFSILFLLYAIIVSIVLVYNMGSAYNDIDPFGKKFKIFRDSISRFCSRFRQCICCEDKISEPLIELHTNKNKKSKEVVKYGI